MAPAPSASQCAILQLSITARKGATPCKTFAAAPQSPRQRMHTVRTFLPFNFSIQRSALGVNVIITVTDHVVLSLSNVKTHGIEY